MPIVQQRWKSDDFSINPNWPLQPFFEFKHESSALWAPITPTSTTKIPGHPDNERVSTLNLPDPGCTDLRLRTYLFLEGGPPEYEEEWYYHSVSDFSTTVPTFRVGTCTITPVTAVPEPAVTTMLFFGIVVLFLFTQFRKARQWQRSKKN